MQWFMRTVSQPETRPRLVQLFLIDGSDSQQQLKVLSNVFITYRLRFGGSNKGNSEQIKLTCQSVNIYISTNGRHNRHTIHTWRWTNSTLTTIRCVRNIYTVNWKTHQMFLIYSLQNLIDCDTRAHHEMRYPNVTWHFSYLFTYLPLNYDTPVFPEYFLSNTYPLHL